MDDITNLSKILRSRRIAIMGIRDREIKDFLSIPKCDSTKATTGEERQKAIQLIMEQEEYKQLKDRCKQIFEQVDKPENNELDNRDK